MITFTCFFFSWHTSTCAFILPHNTQKLHQPALLYWFLQWLGSTSSAWTKSSSVRPLGNQHIVQLRVIRVNTHHHRPALKYWFLHTVWRYDSNKFNGVTIEGNSVLQHIRRGNVSRPTWKLSSYSILLWPCSENLRYRWCSWFYTVGR